MNQIKTVFLFIFLYSILIKGAYSFDWVPDKEFSYPSIEKCYEVMKDGVLLENDEDSSIWIKDFLYEDLHYRIIYTKSPPKFFNCSERKFKRK